MRIQHNIMAMNAYRNYTNNVSAMKANLEKLSSGYKINRAGDDAAGLAISEKMRAQITGLETAQKNAKDGISLVQTAEGALTEVHDMLNRMVELATQSANGTYDNDTDRYQLQKEMDQLKSEIDRIADSSNFNGIKLLDGSMSTDANVITGDARIINDVYTSGNAAELSGTKTFLDGEVATQAVATVFDVDFTGLTAKSSAAGGAGGAGGFTAQTPDAGKTADLLATVDFSAATVDATAIAAIKAGVTVNGVAVNLSDVADAMTAGTTTGAEALAAVKTAIETQVGAANTAAANGTTDYNKTDVKNVAAKGTTGLTVTYDSTPMKYDAAAGGGGDPVTFTFKIGGTEFAGVTAAADDDADAIAAAVKDALDAVADAADNTVKIDGNKYTYTQTGSKVTFTLADTPTEKNIAANFDWDVTGDDSSSSFDGNHTAGVIVTTAGSVYKDAPLANTVFKIEASDIKDGTKITIDGTTVTLAVGKNSSVKTTDANGTALTDVIDLTWMEESSVDLNQAISAISKGFATGTTNFIVGVNDTSNGDTHPGLTVHKKDTSSEKYDTKAKLASVFSLSKPAGNGLTLQIGDTADTYNQLKVSISDCHSASLGLSGVDISTQDGAASAVDAIKKAINKVSDVRGTLGATQNRLDHTINNLSVMTENIQDAESTIRDTDVAEEMMAYTKNNILIQSAQAMLAQANQVPQGVLQLLQ